jgi:phosphatidylglycerol---prolipoprotein diacylglyceryl transferase
MITVNIDPVIFSLGPLQIRWYGLMYVVGFIITGFLLKKLVKRDFFKVSVEKIDSLFTHMILGMFLGARIFYVFVYNWDYYSENLSELLSVWQGGLSFHGAILGLIVGGYIFARRNKILWIQVMDASVLAGTQGLFWGRMGNFINGELYGRITDVPWAMVFPSGGPLSRHPSQLYEGLLEGVILFFTLWAIGKRTKYYGQVSSLFLLGYGIFRFSVEFFREPDSQLGLYFGRTTSMGQILCFVMVISGIGLYRYYGKKRYLV